ncbi:MAG: hypothetical protein AAGU27_03800 [Dehalobacterium sp.]
MNKLMNKWMSKVLKILTWSICGSLILSLLMGGVAAYSIPYQGLDMPIRLHSNENINWAQLIKEEDKFFSIKDDLLINKKSIIFKAALGYLGETGQIGRGPPKNQINSFLIRVVRIGLIDIKHFNIKDLIVKT